MDFRENTAILKRFIYQSDFDNEYLVALQHVPSYETADTSISAKCGSGIVAVYQPSGRLIRGEDGKSLAWEFEYVGVKLV